MQTVVVGFEGSATAHQAVAEASVLARACTAHLHVVTVIDNAAIRQGIVAAGLQQLTGARAEQINAELVDGPGPALAGIETTGHVLHGAAAATIVTLASDVDADISSLATYGSKD